MKLLLYFPFCPLAVCNGFNLSKDLYFDMFFLSIIIHFLIPNVGYAEKDGMRMDLGCSVSS